MSKTAIQLERRDAGAKPQECERAYLLLDDDGSVLAVAGPDVSCVIGARRCISALAEIGYQEDEFSVGPVVWVSEETMRMYLRSWGPESRAGILRQAREICKEHNVVLSTEATTERFDKAADRELAAALWFLWLGGESTGVALGNCTPDAELCKDEVCQIGAFVFYLGDDGRVTSDEFPSVAAAAQRVSEISAQRNDCSGPDFRYLAERDEPAP